MEFPVWFETLTVQAQNVVKVWLRHPYRMILCDLAELIQQERESKSVHLANHFTLIPGTYTVYRSLPPVQDCKMPVLIEERESGTGTGMESLREQFVLEREEFQRIVSTARSVLSLL